MRALAAAATPAVGARGPGTATETAEAHHEQHERRSPAATGSRAGSASAACRPCTWRSTSGSSATSRSSCSPSTWPTTRRSSRASVARRSRRRGWCTRTSSRCSTSASTSGHHQHFIVMEHVARRTRAPSCCATGAISTSTQARRDRHPGLPRARLRAPQRRRAPRRQAGQPARLGRGRRQARRLRDRQGDRSVEHHPGRLGARHRRLSGARAGARRGGRPAGRHLLARRRRLPAAVRAAAVRGDLAVRAGAQAAARVADPARRARSRRHAGARPGGRDRAGDRPGGAPPGRGAVCRDAPQRSPGDRTGRSRVAHGSARDQGRNPRAATAERWCRAADSRNPGSSSGGRPAGGSDPAGAPASVPRMAGGRDRNPSVPRPLRRAGDGRCGRSWHWWRSRWSSRPRSSLPS